MALVEAYDHMHISYVPTTRVCASRENTRSKSFRLHYIPATSTSTVTCMAGFSSDRPPLELGMFSTGNTKSQSKICVNESTSSITVYYGVQVRCQKGLSYGDTP